MSLWQLCLAIVLAVFLAYHMFWNFGYWSERGRRRAVEEARRADLRAQAAALTKEGEQR